MWPNQTMILRHNLKKWYTCTLSPVWESLIYSFTNRMVRHAQCQVEVHFSGVAWVSHFRQVTLLGSQLDCDTAGHARPAFDLLEWGEFVCSLWLNNVQKPWDFSACYGYCTSVHISALKGSLPTSMLQLGCFWHNWLALFVEGRHFIHKQPLGWALEALTFILNQWLVSH